MCVCPCMIDRDVAWSMGTDLQERIHATLFPSHA